MSSRTSTSRVSDDPKASSTILIGILGVILLFVIVVAVQAAFYNLQHKAQMRASEGAPRQLSRLRAEQTERISSYAWLDRENGVVAMPIEQAMALIVKEQAAPAGSAGETR